ncbi:hypothetical protein BpHYR1_041986, partial [Brachionus plicatilis]
SLFICMTPPCYNGWLLHTVNTSVVNRKTYRGYKEGESFTRPVPARSQPEPTIKIYPNVVVNVDAEAIQGGLNLSRGRLLNKSAIELRRPAVSVFQPALDLSGPTTTKM